MPTETEKSGEDLAIEFLDNASQGPTGESGADTSGGTTGAIGATGSTGENATSAGATGATGETDNKGATGEAGSAGPSDPASKVAELARLIDEKTAVDNQHAALRRKTEKLEERERELEARERELSEKKSSPADIFSFISEASKSRGVSEDAIWREVASALQNNGKPSEAALMASRVERLEREKREADESAKKQKEQEASNSAIKAARVDWASTVDEMLEQPIAAQAFPKLMGLDKNVMFDLIAYQAIRHEESTGQLPRNPLKFIQDLEKHLPAPEPPKQPEAQQSQKKGNAAKVPTGENAQSSSSDRRQMTEEERAQATIEWLDNLKG